jgi:hypothetical protein
LNPKKDCYAARCILCGAEIPEEQGSHFDAMMDLCSNCRYRSEKGAPELFVHSIERFLIGNVL